MGVAKQCAAHNAAVLVVKAGHSGSHMIAELFQREASTWRFQSEMLNNFYSLTELAGVRAMAHLHEVWDCSSSVQDGHSGFSYDANSRSMKATQRQAAPCPDTTNVTSAAPTRRRWLTGGTLNLLKDQFLIEGINDDPEQRLPMRMLRQTVQSCNVKVMTYLRCNKLAEVLSRRRGLGPNISTAPMTINNVQKLFDDMAATQRLNEAHERLARRLAGSKPHFLLTMEAVLAGASGPELPAAARAFVGLPPLNSAVELMNKKRQSIALSASISNFAQILPVLRNLTQWRHTLPEYQPLDYGRYYSASGMVRGYGCLHALT